MQTRIMISMRGYSGKENRKNDSFVKALALYFVMLPIGTLSIGTVGSLLKIFALLPGIIWILESHATQKCPCVIYSALFVFWLALSMFWTVDLAGSYQVTSSYLMFLMMLVAVAAYEYSDQDILFLKKSLIWSARLTVVCTFLFAGRIDGRLRMSGIMNEDPNYLCMYFSFGLAYCMEKVWGNNKISDRLKALVELLVYIYIIVFTGSRGGSLAIMTVLMVAYFQMERRKPNTLRIFAGKCAILLMGTIGVVLLANMIPETVLQRFNPTVIGESGGVGRYQLWLDSINAFGNANVFRQLFGFGTGSILTVAREFSFSKTAVVHNIFLQTLLEVGLIGLALFLVFVLGFWNGARKSGNIFALSVISGMIVLSLSISMYTFKPYWNIMLFILCLTRQKESLDIQEVF